MCSWRVPGQIILTRAGVAAAALAVVVSLSSNTVLAMSEAMQQCLLERLQTAEPGTTVDELTAACEQRVGAAGDSPEAESAERRKSVVELRAKEIVETRERQFVISTYRPNYFLYTYNDDPNQGPFEQFGEDELIEEDEVKFQVSFKMPVATGLFGGNTDLIFAYTAKSWWQAFNDDTSKPFRETNYEPELIFRSYLDEDFMGLNLIYWDIGYNHQSNGRSQLLSRSWDRIVAATAVELSDDMVLGLRAWYRIPESRKDDDNPRMHRYYGYGDLWLGWAPDRNTYTLKLQQGTEKNAFELTWSRPISKYMRVYTQYWNGYGESLLDYDVRTERIGVGIALSDYLARQ